MKVLLPALALALSLAACQEASEPEMATVRTPSSAVSFNTNTVGRTAEGYVPTRAVSDARARLTRAFVQGLKQQTAPPSELYATLARGADALGDPVMASSIKQSGAQILLQNVAAQLTPAEIEAHVRLLVEAGSPNASAVAAGLERLALPEAERSALATQASEHATTFLRRRCGACADGAGKAGADLRGTTDGAASDPATRLGDAQLQTAYDGVAALARWTR